MQKKKMLQKLRSKCRNICKIQRLLILGVFLVCSFPVAIAFETGWDIETMHVTAAIQKNTSVHIQEVIKVRFDQEKRGIIRDIPITYTNSEGKSFDIGFDVISVTKEDGSPWEYTVYYEYPFQKIRIGNPNVFLTGEQTYVISYNVKETFVELPEHLEYFWNVTGAWPVALGNATYTVTAFDAPIKDTRCYVGIMDSTDSSRCTQTVLENGKKAEFRASDTFAPSEQMSSAVLVPKEYFILPAWYEKAWKWFLNNWSFLLPFLSFLALCVNFILYGKEHARGTIVPQWHPPAGMHPLEMGVLENDKSENRDVVATLLQFAVQKHITITKNAEKAYTFTKISEPTDMTEAERVLWKKLFDGRESVTTESLKYTFYTTLTKVFSTSYEAVTKKGWYYKNPDIISSGYLAYGWLLAIGGVMFGSMVEQLLTVFGSVIVGVVFIFMSGWMPKKTREGMKLYADVLGLKEYISRAEKYTLDFHNAPEKNPTEFERLLPYAVVLGIEEKWIHAFRDILSGTDTLVTGTNFSTADLSHTLSTFSRTTSTALSVAPASTSSGGSSTSSSFSSSGGSSFSSGGGSSGGGFGGGGGSSW